MWASFGKDYTQNSSSTNNFSFKHINDYQHSNSHTPILEDDSNAEPPSQSQLPLSSEEGFVSDAYSSQVEYQKEYETPNFGYSQEDGQQQYPRTIPGSQKSQLSEYSQYSQQSEDERPQEDTQQKHDSDDSIIQNIREDESDYCDRKPQKFDFSRSVSQHLKHSIAPTSQPQNPESDHEEEFQQQEIDYSSVDNLTDQETKYPPLEGSSSQNIDSSYVQEILIQTIDEASNESHSNQGLATSDQLRKHSPAANPLGSSSNYIPSENKLAYHLNAMSEVIHSQRELSVSEIEVQMEEEFKHAKGQFDYFGDLYQRALREAKSILKDVEDYKVTLTEAVHESQFVLKAYDKVHHILRNTLQQRKRRR